MRHCLYIVQFYTFKGVNKKKAIVKKLLEEDKNPTYKGDGVPTKAFVRRVVSEVFLPKTPTEQIQSQKTSSASALQKIPSTPPNPKKH